MAAKAIQICGTGSSVGKSVIVAGLCRIFLQDGFRVAPFKAQNMSLNSFVTSEGGEIGRAQAMQAAACRLKPLVDMNPILLKPTSDKRSQVILRGRPVGNMSVMGYKDYKKTASREVLDSFNRLKKNFEVIVIEGAGSPSEVNLKRHDIVNMKMAQAVDAPVILVGDIDKGGVFAWLIGTMDLLDKKERKMIKGFIINKFRGDKRLLRSGLNFLEKKTGIKVLGVIPYFKDIKLPEEDSVSLENRPRSTIHDPRLSAEALAKAESIKQIDVAVIRLPHISNFTDFDSLENEPDVNLRYITDKNDLGSADVIIIPGTKNTITDLIWLKKTGLTEFLRITNNEQRTTIIGICGGYQMLGKKIRDESHIESRKQEISGLGLLPIITNFKKEKILAQIKAREMCSNLEVSGYEIHHGRTLNQGKVQPIFKITERDGKKREEFDGSISCDGRVWGTYIHGVFDSDNFRRDFLNRLRAKKTWHPIARLSSIDLDKELDKLAQLLRDNIDMKFIYKILIKK